MPFAPPASSDPSLPSTLAHRAHRAPAWARTAAWVLFGALSVVHVSLLVAGPADLATATKLTLMPALLLAATLQAWPAGRGAAFWVLAAALCLSWLGDGAAVLTPFLPTLPAMLGFFAVAHVAYIVLFWRLMPRRRAGWWSAWVPVWWVAMVVLVAPHAGGLAVAVAAYGVVLGCTAIAARRGPSPAAWGGVLFLVSDSLLAFWLFVPEAPAWLSPAVMATYCAGQGLLAWAASRELGRG